MTSVIFLETSPLGMLTNPRRSPVDTACANWLQQRIGSGSTIIIPEIADYEIRRELLRANQQEGLRRLDAFILTHQYLPLNTAAMRKAAELWAHARQSGQPTASDKTIDGDMILLGQALTYGAEDYIIATTNVGHLSRFAQADLWENIG